MDKKIIAGILLFCLIVIFFSIFPVVPDSSVKPTTSNEQFLPWQIESTANGSIRVFGLQLNKSTLLDAQKLYRLDPELSLFISADGVYKVEAYYDKVILGGFAARMVLLLEPEQGILDSMAQRGTRISNLGGKRKKVRLSPSDQQQLMQQAITSVTYLTRAKLDADILLKRFGRPAQRLSEQNTPTTHWLYPEQGLDIALDGDGNAVLQYVAPQHFTRLLQPLLQQMSTDKPAG